MSNYETLLVEKEEWIGTITLNRPERLNAFNTKMREEFPQSMREMAGDPDVRVVVVTGAGDAFSAGADIHDFAAAVELRGEDASGRSSTRVGYKRDADIHEGDGESDHLVYQRCLCWDGFDFRLVR